MKVLLHADSLIRDAGPMLVLSEILKSLGHQVVVSSRISTHLYLKIWRPDYLLHSNPTAVSALINKGRTNKDNLHIGVFPQEGMESHSETIHSFYQAFDLEGITEHLHKIFLWNAYQKKWILNNLKISSEKLEVIGNARLDLSKFASVNTGRANRIGFLGRFPTLNKYDGSLNLLNFAFTVHEERSVRARLNRLNDGRKQLATATIYGEIIHHILRNTNYVVSIRPHHDESSKNEVFLKLQREYPDRFEVDRRFSIYEWASSVKVIISTTSTAFAEAYLARTPVIGTDMMLDNAGWADDDERIILNSQNPVLMPHSLDECFRLIEECLAGQHPVEERQATADVMKSTLGWPYPGSGLRRIADEICSVNHLEVKRRCGILPAVIEFIAILVHLGLSKLSFSKAMDKHYSSLVHGTPLTLIALAREIINERRV